MDGWQEHCRWAAEAINVIRERFLVSTMTAILELHCPLNFSAPTKKDPVAKRGRKRAAGTLKPIPFQEIQKVQKERSTPDVATLGATRWFATQACAIQQKQATISCTKSEGRAFPALTLLKKACQLQQDELKEARSVWENRTGGKSRNDGIEDDLAFCFRLESRSSNLDHLPETPLLHKLTMFEQALFTWASNKEDPIRLFSAAPGAWAGIPTLESAPVTLPRTTSTGLITPMLYGGWFWSVAQIQSLQRESNKRGWTLLGIVPVDLRPSDSFLEGPEGWWPEPPSGEGGSRTPEKQSMGRLVIWHHSLNKEPIPQHPTIPDWLSLWPRLFRDHPALVEEPQVGEAYRGTLLVDMAHTLRSGPKGQWWWPEGEGAMGQALHTGLWSNEHGNSISISMPRKEGAQLYATSYWNRGVLLASTMQCREALATAIRDLDLPTISPVISARLYQHACNKPNNSRVEGDHHGWEGEASHLVGMTTVTDPVSGAAVPFIPCRRHPGHEHATPQRFRDLLQLLLTSFFDAPGQKQTAAHLDVQPWHSLVTTGACSGRHCSRNEIGIPESGMVLMNGAVLCRGCHRKWEHHVRKELGFHRSPKCPRDVDGRCLSCTSMDAKSRPKLRSLLIRDQIRDLTHALFSHLATNTQGYVANILFRQVRTLHRGHDHLLMISVPAVIHLKVLGLLAWHYYDKTVRFIQSVRKCDYSADEPWAMECRKELATIQFQQPLTSQSRPTEVAEEEEEFFRGSASLRALRVQLRPHSSMSASLLHTPEGCRLLYDRLGIHELSQPDPADWCIRHTSEAQCKICGTYEHDLMEVSVDAIMGEPVYNCMSCNGWWHESCMSATDRQTLPSVLIANVEDGAAPPWRCQDCVKNDQYAVQRVLEVVRGEDGQFYLLLEYLGYRYLEVRLENRLVDRNSELKRAYREHANTRSSISMLYCAGAILDAMWHGQ